MHVPIVGESIIAGEARDKDKKAGLFCRAAAVLQGTRIVDHVS